MARMCSHRTWPRIIALCSVSNGGAPSVTVPSTLIERTGRRLLRHRQASVLGFFLPLAIVAGMAWPVLLAAFFFHSHLVLLPLGLFAGDLPVALPRGRKLGHRHIRADAL